MKLKDRQVLVIGAGRSGMGAAGLLLRVGAWPLIYDANPDLDIQKLRSGTEGGERLRFCLGESAGEALREVALAVISPGVPCDNPFVQEVYRAGIPVWSEIELAWQTTKGQVVAITGTNGKTTTTALVGHIMEQAAGAGNVFVVGNIGEAWTSHSLQTKDDSVTVAEISSFQLETIDTFAPHVSAILNITEDHLNRHHTMEEYIRVKELITRNQTASDYCILNYEDPVLREFGQNIKPKVIWFSSQRPLSEGFFLRGEEIIFSDGTAETPVLKTDRLRILGRHNYENAMAAAAMAHCMGVDFDTIRSAAESFTAVPHRIEFVEEKKGVAYYNDSKGTNPDAAIQGIRAMNRPTWLIGGGYDKQADYSDWIRAFDGKVRALVLIGQTREKIARAAEDLGFTDVVLCDDLKEAVAWCAGRACAGEAVLLSPACASWGQFDNYEQRGDVFKELVRALPE